MNSHPEEPTYEQLAGELRRARLAATRVPREYAPALDVAAGLDVQRAGRALDIEAGERIAGRKVGLTSAEAQRANATTEPVSGYLLESTIEPCSTRFDCSGLVAPRLEVEVAFLLGQPLEGASLEIADVLAATRALAPALEVVDSRWDGGAPSAGPLLADNVSAAAALVGIEVDPYVGIDELRVEATVGPNAASGSVANVLGHPARSVAWLCADLSRRGERLEAGDLVLSGALCGPISVRAGDAVQADLGSLGRLRTTFVNAPHADEALA